MGFTVSKMKKCLIFVNTGKEKSKTLAEKISAFLKKNQIEVSLYNFDGIAVKNPVKGYDFVITLGGDGTVLYAARCCTKLDIPVFPINLGEFGFIASIQPDAWQKPLSDFINGKAVLTERSLVKAELIRSGKPVVSAIGLNDVVISAKEAAKTISLEIRYNNLNLCELRADGAIFSTPTGSTAYSTSAGGPIIDPELDAIVFTPVNPFSLSTRPIVLNPDGKIEVLVKESRTKEIVLSIDGQKPYPLIPGDLIKISRNEKKVRLASCTSDNFYNALRSKLNWQGGPHA